jgi:hypothetical protein
LRQSIFCEAQFVGRRMLGKSIGNNFALYAPAAVAMIAGLVPTSREPAGGKTI